MKIWREMDVRFKVASIAWWVFLLLLIVAMLLQKPERPHIGDPFDSKNPFSN